MKQTKKSKKIIKKIIVKENILESINEEKKKKQEEKKRIKEEEKRIKEEEKRIKEEEEGYICYKQKEENLKKEYEILHQKEIEERNKLENDSSRWSEFEKLKIDYHSIGEIREKLLDSLKNPIEVIYSSQPKLKILYNLGKISQKTLDMTIFIFFYFYIFI